MSGLGTKRIVYIASLAHSGSTLLELLLTSHTKLVGLGEVHSVIKRGLADNWPCSCGEKAAYCPFWGPLYWRDAQSVTYSDILKNFRYYYGKEHILVDSSKNLSYLKELYHQGYDLSVIFLIRDVRSWTVAMLANSERKGKRSIVRDNAFSLFLLWFYKNWQQLKFLEQLSYICIGYEQLCLQPRRTLNRIFEFLRLEPETDFLPSLEHNKSHIIAGNRMRSDPQKGKELYYDDRWLYSNEWVLPSLMFWPFMRFNERLVYQPEKMWQR